MKSKKAQGSDGKPRRPSLRNSIGGSRKSLVKSKGSTTLWRRIARILFLSLIVFLSAIFILFGAVYIGLFGKLPDKVEILALRNSNASELFSADGVLLGKYFIENRSSINFDEIPERAVQALIATEDSRFFEHEGIDPYSIPRVIIKTLILGDRSSGGGSTISQQLVKNLFGRKDYGALSMPVNKLKENVIALKIEDVYTKEEIITLYLNTVSFGENLYGIKAASQRYFSKRPEELSINEAATLIGMLKANTSYNPRLHPEASMRRRNTVLGLMVKEGFLEVEDLNGLIAQPLGLRYRNTEGSDRQAAYLRAHVEKELRTILEEAGKREGTTYDLYRDGLKITTTINARLQQYAEEVVAAHMLKLQASFEEHWSSKKPWGKDEEFVWKAARQSDRYKKLKARKASDDEIRKEFTSTTEVLCYTNKGYIRAQMSPLDSVAYHQLMLQTGFLAMDVRSGAVLAYIGGINFGHFPYDHVHASRQVGSTFKPFVYAAAIEYGHTPCDYIENERITFSDYDNWSPENSNGQYGGLYSLTGGLANSVNTIAARLIYETGPDAVADIARRAGITSPIPKGPAISLGVANLTLLEMVTAYASFANGGKRLKAHYITSISSADGKLIYEAKPEKPVQSIDAYTALTTLHMMQAVVDSGTARSLRGSYGIRAPLAGKTGTTQNNADGWFIATTPHMAIGSWVGGQSPLVRFRSTALGQGAATAMPMVGNFLRKAERDAATSKLIGRSFPVIPADTLLDSYCPMYKEREAENFFQELFDTETRDVKQEMRQKIREERKQRKSEDETDDNGWMQRMLDKLKKEE